MTTPSLSKDIESDSGHWYTQSGEPYYTLIGNNGKERPVTLRDARKLGLLPSVTSTMSMLPKPGLIVWQKRQVLMSALTLTRLPEESDDAYIARIMADANEQAMRARARGTAIHGAIERFICGQSIEDEYKVYVRSALVALTEHLQIDTILDKCEAEKSFACPDLMYGGKVDLHSRDLNIVADFKTKEFTEETERLAWDEQAIQLEAYRQGLGMPDARMINVFISTSVPGLVRVVEHEGDPKYWKIFLSCLNLWKAVKSYG